MISTHSPARGPRSVVCPVSSGGTGRAAGPCPPVRPGWIIRIPHHRDLPVPDSSASCAKRNTAMGHALSAPIAVGILKCSRLLRTPARSRSSTSARRRTSTCSRPRARSSSRTRSHGKLQNASRGRWRTPGPRDRIVLVDEPGVERDVVQQDVADRDLRGADQRVRIVERAGVLRPLVVVGETCAQVDRRLSAGART